MKIEEIKNPDFLKGLSNEQLTELCADIRSFLVSSVSKTGGHLSSNLGIVEVSVELLKVFDTPKDKIVYDVGHQSYVHKILTGRAGDFVTLRQYGGISGFQKRCESPYDPWEAGHSSTSLSAALGMAIARDLSGHNENIIAVIGDGALGGGMSLEALNHISEVNSKVIIVLNDNEMSISKPIGAVTRILSSLRMSKIYRDSKHDLKEHLSHNVIGEKILDGLIGIRDGLKKRLLDTNFFLDLGIEYLGPIDGHNLSDLESAFLMAKEHDGSIIVHVVTKKGKGYEFAENDTAGKWHGVGPFDIDSGKSKKILPSNCKSYSEIVADFLLEYRKQDSKLTVLTPAMISGSKLNQYFDMYPESSFDCGIAEEHTITMAGSLALSGMHPFVSIYSSFLQRAYDQVNHDIARMRLPVVVGIDRAGLVGEDGETHHGVFDISFLRPIPNIIICEPKDYNELRSLLYTGFISKEPFFIRYPRGNAIVEKLEPLHLIPIGSYEEVLGDTSSDVCVFSYGVDIPSIIDLCKSYEGRVAVVNARFFKPIDEDLLLRYQTVKNWIVYEEDQKCGGLSSAISEFITDNRLPVCLKRIGIDDHFVTHGNTDILKKVEHIALEDLKNEIEELL